MNTSSPSTDYNNCLNAFMQGVHSDLDQDISDKCSKFSYDFREDQPMTDGDIKWTDISEI